jgi:glucokinase
MTLAIGVDVGGTKLAAGVVDDRGRITERLERLTPSSSPPDTAATISEAVTELRGRHPVRAVGVGAAGYVDEARSTVLFAPHLAWRDEPLRKELEDRAGCPVVVENDANASVWAETRFGAARGYRHIVMVTIGTGIGTGIVIDGNVYRGHWGIGGEAGHYRVVPGGRLCQCGNRGCWEQYASGNALVAEARDRARESPRDAARLLQLGGGTADGIGGRQVTRAAAEGDPLALHCFQIIGAWLGQGLADLAAILDPGCFVVGGGVSAAGDLLLDPARARLADALTGRGYRPPAEVRAAELGADAGLVGAADLARAQADG